MADIILKTENLGISFGGLKAVQDVNIEIKKKQLYGLVGPNGAGKTTVFNMLTGVYRPTTGHFYLGGEDLTGKSQETINHKGIARTFQNIRLFNNMTVIRNVLVGLHNQPEFKCSMIESMLRLPRHFKCEREMREKAKSILRVVGLEEERNYLPGYAEYDSKQMAKMTHVEFFTYPVWEAETPKREELLARRLDSAQPVLFDYKERDVITRDCRIVLLPMP